MNQPYQPSLLPSPGATVLCMLVAGAAILLLPSRGWGQAVVARNLLDQFAKPGIDIPGGVQFPIASPALHTKQTRAEQMDVLQSLSGKIGWELFSKRSAVAPVQIELETIQDSTGQRVGHSIHTAFIAYVDFDSLRDRQLMEAVFGKVDDAESSGNAARQTMVMTELTTDELKVLGIVVEDSVHDSYLRVELPLLNKIIVRGILHLQMREGSNWFQLAWQLDPRFALTDEVERPISNAWTKLVPNAVGKLEESAPLAYSGCGGYVHVFATGLAPEQLLVESRLILHEPADWFAGSNYLRSKLPLSMQESARSFRRKLMKK